MPHLRGCVGGTPSLQGRQVSRSCAGPWRSAIRSDEALQHRHDELEGIGDGLAALAGQNLGIGNQVAVKRPRQLHGGFHRLVLDDGAEFQFRHGQPPAFSNTKSRVTMILTGKPGRIVSVGATCNWRWTIC